MNQTIVTAVVCLILGGVITHFVLEPKPPPVITTKPGIVRIDIGQSRLDSAIRATEIRLIPKIEEEKDIARRTRAAYALLADKIVRLQDSLKNTNQVPLLSASIETTLTRVEPFGKNDSLITLHDTAKATVQFVAPDDPNSLPVGEWIEFTVRHEKTPVELDTVVITQTVSEGVGFFHNVKVFAIGAAVGVTTIKLLDAIGKIGH